MALISTSFSWGHQRFTAAAAMKAPRGGVRATQAELVRQRSRQPPHPQAGRAGTWAATWLGTPIEVADEHLLTATESIQRDIAAGYTGSALDHLGEAASIALLQSLGKGRLIGDDHAARAESRKRGVKAISTVGGVAHLLTVAGSGPDRAVADTYLQTLQARKRMHAQLTSIDLLAGDLGPWQRPEGPHPCHPGGPPPCC